MINRHVTRTILNSLETTKETRSINSDTLAFVVGAADKFYVGFPGRYANRYVSVSTVNTNTVNLTVKTWDGTAYQPVEDLIDETEGFTKSGWVHWNNREDRDWEKHAQTPIDDTELYWTEWSFDASTSAGTALQSVLNLFSDDDDLRAYYPSLVTDTRWLPDGRTDFLEQHDTAKKLVVLRMQQRRLITDESQIIDINSLNTAAVHACASLIYAGAGGGEEIRAMSDAANAKFENEVDELRLNVDENKDGIVSSAERDDISSETDLTRR